MKNVEATKAIDAHIKKWQQIGEHLQNLTMPPQKELENLQRLMGLPLQSEEIRQQNITPFLKVQADLDSNAALVGSLGVKAEIIRSIEEFKESFRQSLEGLINPALEGLRQSFDELPAKTQKALLILGEHGWYLDLDMSADAPWEIKRALEDGSVIEVESALEQYFEAQLEKIEASIIKKFPNREKQIMAAFSAHRRSEYDLSIPVFLAQADGICKETIDYYLFMKRNGKPQTALYVEQIAADTYMSALLSPLAKSLPINKSEKERDPDFTGLNRHMVLHGESLDYGTKVNSLKAISLISYLVQILEPIKFKS